MFQNMLFVLASAGYGAVGQTKMGGATCINNNNTHHPTWQLVVCQQQLDAPPPVRNKLVDDCIDLWEHGRFAKLVFDSGPSSGGQWPCGLTLRRFSISCGCFSPRL
jgi:hypothetical protein